MGDQGGTLTDREKAGLRGPVQRCDNENLFVGPTGSEAALPQRPVPSYDSYDPDGNLIERWHGNPNGMEWKVCRYDRDRKLVEQEYLGTSMTADRKFSYQYDASGRLERVVATAQDGSERVSESYRYDAQGCKTLTRYPGKPLEGCGVSNRLPSPVAW